jgi:hypothetical protein
VLTRLDGEDRPLAVFAEVGRPREPGHPAPFHDRIIFDGIATWYIVKELAQHLGTSEASAGQTLIAAMDKACPGYTVGADGVARAVG